MFDVVVIGSLNMDIAIKTSRAPKAGETIMGESFQMVPGGKGANQAVAASKMGADSAMVGCVGEDNFGQLLVEGLVEQKVNVDHVTRLSGVSTGIASITVERNGENRIIIVPGANDRVSLDRDPTLPSLLSVAKIVILQNEIPMETNQHVIEAAQKDNTYVMWNPAPAYHLPEGILSKIDFLVLNEVEAAFLTEQDVKSVPTALKAALVLYQAGARKVVVTLGGRGAVLVSKNHHLHVPAHPVDVVDTTSAGDSFVGGLAASIVREDPVEEALRYAVCAGCLTVTKMGAQPSIPTHTDVTKLLPHVTYTKI